MSSGSVFALLEATRLHFRRHVLDVDCVVLFVKWRCCALTRCIAVFPFWLFWRQCPAFLAGLCLARSWGPRCARRRRALRGRMTRLTNKMQVQARNKGRAYSSVALFCVGGWMCGRMARHTNQMQLKDIQERSKGRAYRLDAPPGPTASDGPVPVPWGAARKYNHCGTQTSAMQRQ